MFASRGSTAWSALQPFRAKRSGRYLICLIGAVEYAIETERVLEIRPCSTPYPSGRGSMAWVGGVAPVTDLRPLLGTAAANELAGSVAIVVHVARHPRVLVVDAVCDVIAIPRVESLRILGDAQLLRCIQGIARIDRRAVLVLHVGRLEVLLRCQREAVMCGDVPSRLDDDVSSTAAGIARMPPAMEMA